MREKVAIVDENDEIIDVKYRDDILDTDIHRIVSVWIENSKGEVLLAQRAFHKKLHPGLWGPAAAGAVSYGETYEEAAYKEMAEEIGLTETPLTFIKKVTFLPNGEKRFIAWYIGLCDKPADQFVLEKDVAQVSWFSKDKLIDSLNTDSKQFVTSHVLWLELFLSEAA